VAQDEFQRGRRRKRRRLVPAGPGGKVGEDFTDLIRLVGETLDEGDDRSDQLSDLQPGGVAEMDGREIDRFGQEFVR
jgi:hypothetical protein